jgi:hypothetical protein
LRPGCRSIGDGCATYRSGQQNGEGRFHRSGSRLPGWIAGSSPAMTNRETPPHPPSRCSGTLSRKGRGKVKTPRSPAGRRRSAGWTENW